MPDYEKRYRKLQGYMSSNVPEGWQEVERMGAISAWSCWEDMDNYLDALPECNVGFMHKFVKDNDDHRNS